MRNRVVVMAVQNSHLRFLPRSVQLSKPPPPPMDTDNKKMNKKKHRNSIDHTAREESNFSPTEEFELQAQRKRKSKIKNSGHVIEEESGKTNSSHAAIRVDGDSNGLKKKKEKKKKRDDPNTHSAEAAELNQLIAGFLSSRGLTNTLSVFLSETQHAYAGKAQTLDLEEIYSHYLNQGSAKFKKQGEVKLREQAGDAVFKDAGKLNKGVKRKGNDIKAMDGKEKYVDDSNAAPPSTGASEQGFYKTDNNHDSAKESMDDLDGHGHSKRTAMGSKNSAVSIGTYEGRNEHSKPTDDLGVVWELFEPVLKFQEVPMKEEKKKKKKKKKKMADESLLSDNNEKVDGKKSKKEKKAHAAKLFSTGFHGINAEAVNGSILDLLEDSRNELDIKKSSLDKTNWRDHEVLCGSKKSKKEEKQFEEKLLSRSSHTVNGEVAKGGRGYLPDDPENLSDMQLSEKKRRSDGMMSGDAQEHISCKKNKKGKQTLEDKLVATELHFSYPINVEVATGCREHSPEDPGKTLDVGVPNKKKKRSDVMIPRDAEEQIEGKKSKKGKKVLAEKSLSTDAHAINGQASKGTMEDLSEGHGNSLHIKMSKKKKKKSDEMVVRDNEDLTGGNKSKKGKKGFEEKLCLSGSHAVNGEMAKESMGGLDADTNNTLDITWNGRILEAKELAKGAEMQSNEHCPVVNGYQERGIPGKLHDGKEVIKGHLPAKSRKSEQQKSDVVEFADPRLQDNSYWAKDGAENGYGAKAQEVLRQVRGKNIRHEKTNKKRGTYTRGMIDVQSHSIKFSYSDEK